MLLHRAVLRCRVRVPVGQRRCAGRHSRPPQTSTNAERDERLFSKNLQDRNMEASTFGAAQSRAWKAASKGGKWGTVDGANSSDFLSGLSGRIQSGADSKRPLNAEQERQLSIMAACAAGFLTPAMLAPTPFSSVALLLYAPALLMVARHVGISATQNLRTIGAFGVFASILPLMKPVSMWVIAVVAFGSVMAAVYVDVAYRA